MKMKKNAQPNGAAQPEEPKNGPSPSESPGQAADSAQTPQPEPADTAGGAENAPQPEEGGENAAKADEQGQKQPSQAELIKMMLQSQQAEIERLGRELDNANTARDAVQSKADALNARLASTLAEYENYRRRTAAEKEALGADATAKAVQALLPALDSLERALDFAEAKPETLREGVQMTCKQFADAFAKLGVSEMGVKAGDAFDPDRHNAVAHVEDEALGESVVAEVFQKGYLVGEKVVRHAVVKVAN